MDRTPDETVSFERVEPRLFGVVERRTHRAVGDAERQIGEERLAIQPTEIVQPPPE